jgi:recombination protein RecT
MKGTAIIPREEQIKGLLIQAHKQIKSILADEKRANRFTAMALAIANSKELSECEPTSIVEALTGVAMLNLSPDKNLGQAYVVPYTTKDKKKIAQLQVGYKGYISILDRSGYAIKAYPVYDVDDFKIEVTPDGWDTIIRFAPNYEERNEGDPQWEWEHLKYVVALAKDKRTGEIYKLILNKKQIDKIRRMSASQKYYDEKIKKYIISDKPIFIWADFPIDMSLKTGIKKLAKMLPLDEFGAKAIAIDDLNEAGKRINYQKTAEAGVIVEADDVKATPEEPDVDINKMLSQKGKVNAENEKK